LDIKSVLKRLRVFVSEQPIWIAILLIYILMTIVSPHFGGISNFINISYKAAMYGFLGLGLTMVLINGNIDLSVGSMLGFTVMVCIFTISKTDSVVLAVILTIVAGLVLGFINGFCVAKLGITSFVVTLASMIGIKGLTFIICKEKSIVGTSESFAKFGETDLFGIPLQIIVFIFLAILMQLMLVYTKHGRESFVIGGNLETAYSSGLNVQRHILSNFVVSGLFVSICAIFTAAAINGATPTLGKSYETMAIIAVVLGGTRLNGGYGGMIRTVGGAFMISLIQNALNMLGTQSYWSQFITGVVLILVIVSNQYLNIGGRKRLQESRQDTSTKLHS
jgi:ribose transport system permease protein